MHTNITARHFVLTDELRRSIEQRLKKLERYSLHIIDAQIILSRDGTGSLAEGKLHLKNEVMTAKTAAGDPYLAASEVIGRLAVQLKRYGQRTRDRKRNSHLRAVAPRTSAG
ncbi:MAG: ribosome-associated translation inhibitor RaiA [candidate division WOR-3 bacterium]